MTTSAMIRERHRPPRSLRGALSLLLAVLLVGSVAYGATLTLTDYYLFNSRRFADRAVSVLDSSVVRDELAGQITDALVANGPSEIASFQNVLRPVIVSMIETSAFRDIFRTAVGDAHQYLFTEGGNAAIVNLSQSLGILTASLRISNPDAASVLPAATDKFLVDLGDEIRGLQLWRVSRDVADQGWTFTVISGLLAIAVVAVDRDRRRGVVRLGSAIAVSGAIMFTIAAILPMIAGSFATNRTFESAIRAAVNIFLADYRNGALWLAAFGIAVAGFAAASAPTTAPRTYCELRDLARRRILDRIPITPATQISSALGLLVVGGLVIGATDLVIRIVAIAAGALVAYLGSVRLLAIVGRRDTETVRHMVLRELRHHRWRGTSTRVALTSMVVIVALVAGAWMATGRARDRSEALQERRCNGHAELCDRTIDRVAFAASHNSMSASDDPGWLFAENVHGIPAQLEYGVRALLVKTHYGIPSGVTLAGAELIITDRVAETEANPAAVEAQLPDPAVLQQRRDAVKNLDPALRDVYLCHVYCEYGALKFTTALGYVRQFLDTHPNNVIIMVIGDYVSKDDTERAFRTAGLFDRLWEYDATAPMPTLGQLIDARHNLVMMSEFDGPPPAWNNAAYGSTGLIADTPFTFRSTSDLFTPGSPLYTGDATVDGPVPDTITTADGSRVFTTDWTGLPSCAPNRGSPTSPMFQINHWVTPSGAAPTVAQARTVNAYDVLLPRVRDCSVQRARFPMIIGVNFYDTGDLMAVVDTMNGFDRSSSVRPSADTEQSETDAGIADTTTTTLVAPAGDAPAASGR